MNIQNHYDKLLLLIEKATPLEFINDFLNKNFFKNKIYFINTRLSKKIEINIEALKNFILGTDKINKEMDMDEEISFILDKANENCKFNEIKNYLPEKIDIELFPTEKKKSNEDNIEDDNSEKTDYTFKDSCQLLNTLNANINELKQKNKIQKEKEKIIVLNKNKSELESEKEDEEDKRKLGEEEEEEEEEDGEDY